MSLKLRLALYNTFFVLLALGLGLALLVFQSRNVFLDSLDRELISRGDRMMRNPGLRERGLLGEPAFQNRLNRQNPQGGIPQGQGLGPQGNDFINPDPEQDPNQGPNPNGQLGQGQPGNPNPNNIPPRRPGQQNLGLGPEFGGPPNDDIGRPILYDPNGKPIFANDTRILDPVALRQRPERRPIVATVSVEGIPTRVITVPLHGKDKLLGYAQFGHDLQDFQRLKETQSSTILFLLPIAIVLSGAVGWLLAGMAVKPINEVARASEKISDSDMSTRLTVTGNDEIGRLSQSFNAMVDRLQLSFEERQRLFVELQTTLEQQKQFVADASHELRTPLARLRITTSSALEQETSPEEMKEALEIADQETVHMSSLVDQLLTLARLDSDYNPALYPVNLSEVAQEAAAKFPADAPNAISLNLAPNVVIQGDHDSLVRAVVNLIENAKRYSPDKEIVVMTQATPDQVILVVRDHGSGIAPQHIAHLTERFYRVDDARNRKMGGTGLGLAIVKSIVEANKGKLVIQSKLGEGTAVQLIFPVRTHNLESK